MRNVHSTRRHSSNKESTQRFAAAVTCQQHHRKTEHGRTNDMGTASKVIRGPAGERNRQRVRVVRRAQMRTSSRAFPRIWDSQLHDVPGHGAHAVGRKAMHGAEIQEQANARLNACRSDIRDTPFHESDVNAGAVRACAPCATPSDKYAPLAEWFRKDANAGFRSAPADLCRHHEKVWRRDARAATRV